MKYDNSKEYTWTNEEIFTLTGRELGLISNTLRVILSTEQAAQILLAHRASQVVEKIITEGVESGKIKEVVPNKQEDEK